MLMKNFIILLIIIASPVYLLSQNWTAEIVDNYEETAEYLDMDIDNNNHIHIAYKGLDCNCLKYAYYNGDSWTKESVPETDYAGSHCSIVVDDQGVPHISHQLYDWNTWILNLYYSTKSNGSWTTTTVDDNPDCGEYTNIMLDSYQKPHIVYLQSYTRNVIHAYKDYGMWYDDNITSEFAQDCGLNTVATIDNNDKIHTIYYNLSDSYMQYSNETTSSWNYQNMDYSQTSGAMTVDSENNIYYVQTTGGLRLDIKSGGEWTNEIIETGTVYVPNIDLDADENIHIVYANSTGALKYAFHNGTSWSTELIPINIGSFKSIKNEQFQPSIKVDQNGNVHIAVQESVNGKYQLVHIVKHNTTKTKEVDLSNNNYNIFPTPANRNLTIKNNSARETNRVEIYNANNQQIKSFDFNNTNNIIDIDLSDFSSGIYFVKIYAENKVVTKRFLVSK